MDTIFIRDLELSCVIGVTEGERTAPQSIRIHVDLEVDLHDAGTHDTLTRTVDYGHVLDQIEAVVTSSRHYLIEALAEDVARACLEDGRVKGVRVSVEKPRALRNAGTPGVTISRRRQSLAAE